MSHNQMGAGGAKALLAAVPTARPGGLRPLWFRVEYNQINVKELEAFIKQVGQPGGLCCEYAFLAVYCMFACMGTMGTTSWRWGHLLNNKDRLAEEYSF